VLTVKENEYLDQRNDFNIQDKEKQNKPKRPQHVQIEKRQKK
jgi:hypothetical protein